MHIMPKILLLTSLFYFMFAPSLRAQVKEDSLAHKNSIEQTLQNEANNGQLNNDYRFNQWIKYTLMHSTVGFLTGTSIAGFTLKRHPVYDGISQGVIIMAGTVVGTSIGFISGTITGLYKGRNSPHNMGINPNRHNRRAIFGYNLNYASILDKQEVFKGGIALHFRGIFKKSYWPDRWDIEYSSKYTDGTHSYKNGVETFSNFTENRFGIIGRYYFNEKKKSRLFYDIATGYAAGNHEKRISVIANSIFDRYEINEKKGFIYGWLALGVEINFFNFAYGQISVQYEPIGTWNQKIKGTSAQRLMINYSMGTYIF